MCLRFKKKREKRKTWVLCRLVGEQFRHRQGEGRDLTEAREIRQMMVFCSVRASLRVKVWTLPLGEKSGWCHFAPCPSALSDLSVLNNITKWWLGWLIPNPAPLHLVGTSVPGQISLRFSVTGLFPWRPAQTYHRVLLSLSSWRNSIQLPFYFFFLFYFFLLNCFSL